MTFIKCFDAVNVVCEEATRQFAPLFKLNEENYAMLKNYCDGIDIISKEADGIAYEVEVDDVEMTISITLECEYLPVNRKDHPLVQLAAVANFFGFYISEDGKLNINFVFPSVWDKI